MEINFLLVVSQDDYFLGRAAASINGTCKNLKDRLFGIRTIDMRKLPSTSAAMTTAFTKSQITKYFDLLSKAME